MGVDYNIGKVIFVKWKSELEWLFGNLFNIGKIFFYRILYSLKFKIDKYKVVLFEDKEGFFIFFGIFVWFLGYNK